jgi:cytochrome c5
VKLKNQVMTTKQKILLTLLFLFSGIAGVLVSLYQHQSKQTDDIQTIQTFHYPAIFVDQLKGDKQAGKKIFKEFCAACHSPEPLIDISAPHIGDAKAWQVRRQWGKPALLQITIHGIKAMPARGGCFECSDAQLQETIDYILNNSQ